MTYPQTLQYLFSKLPMFQRIGAAAYKADLTNTIELCRIMNNPEKGFKSVHIAGTNGKGSTSHFLASILQEAGYTTGLFTSPHLKDYRERIKINGRPILKSEVIAFVQTYREAFDSLNPSFFEWSFACAMHHFANHKVDVAIIETGMGGRLDSTNILHPALSIITNISMDHTQFLGNSIKEIASEKAGIIKEEVPVIIGETQTGASEIFIETSKRLNAPIFFADQHFSIHDSGLSHYSPGNLWIRICEGETPFPGKFYSSLVGSYQNKNLLTVFQSVKLLNTLKYSISIQHVRKGIRKVVTNTGIKGRWQVLSNSPLTVADIGHNKAGIQEIVKQINAITFNHLHFILGVVNDKDVKAMLDLLPTDATYYFCKADIPRGMETVILKEIASSSGLSGDGYPSVKAALLAAQDAAFSNDMIVIGGSAFVVAEVV